MSSSSSSSLFKERVHINQEEKRDDEEATTSGMAIGPRVPTLPCLVKNIVEDAIEVLIFEDRCSTNGYNNENRSPNAKGNDSASAEDPKPAAVFPSSLERYNVDSAASENPRKRDRRRVSFGHVEFRSYNLTVGDHPFCRDSCPLTMEWEHTVAVTENITHQDCFSSSSQTNSSSHNTTGKRSGRPRRLTLNERRERIVQVNGLDGIQSVLQVEIERRKEYLHQLICDDVARRPESKWMTCLLDSQKRSSIIDEHLVKLDEIVAAAASRKEYLHQHLRDDAVRRPETKWMTSLLDIDDDDEPNEDEVIRIDDIVPPPASCRANSTASPSMNEIVTATASYRTTKSSPPLKKALESGTEMYKLNASPTPCHERPANVLSSPSLNSSCPYALQAPSA